MVKSAILKRQLVYRYSVFGKERFPMNKSLETSRNIYLSGRRTGK